MAQRRSTLPAAPPPPKPLNLVLRQAPRSSKWPKEAKPAPPVERVSDADREILDEFYDEIAAHQTRLTAAHNGLAIVARRLTKRYNLGPHDVVEMDGTISRGKLLADPLTPHVTDAPPPDAPPAAEE